MGWFSKGGVFDRVIHPNKQEEYSGEGSEHLKKGQKKKLARWEDDPDKQWKVDAKKEKWLEKQAPDYDWQKQQRADLMALQQADDIEALRAKIAAGETGLSDAELEQKQDAERTAAAQQQAAQEERVQQEALAQGASSAHAQRMVDDFREDKGADAQQAAAKASQRAWASDLAQKAQEQQRYDAMRAAYTAAYDESDSGAGADIWSQVLDSAGSFAELVAQQVSKSGDATPEIDPAPSTPPPTITASTQ